MKVVACSPSSEFRTTIDSLVSESFFASPDFADTWRTMGGTPYYHVIQDAGEIRAVLPGVTFGRGPFRRLYAMPNGCYGGLFVRDANRSETAEVAGALMGALSSVGFMKCFIFDFGRSLESYLPSTVEVRQCRTTLVDISPTWQPPNKKLRQQIHKAERIGLHIEPFCADSHLQQFLSLVKSTSERIGPPRRMRYTESFFRDLAALALKDRRLRWLWCEHDGKPVSSNIFVVEANSLLHWQAYFNTDFSHLQAAKYIPFAMARAAAQEGITQLNLGATPENAPGVEYFKEKWGGRPCHYNCYVRESFFGKLL
ncbi:MAG TPA: GNAT family N-acetyltransferase [Candidatus Deferrimicrobium sp.]|nr:GNAT family N-acetyltransferase [Candidatus Deferrimicrobium sp.]